jgi:hypothetical protein
VSKLSSSGTRTLLLAQGSGETGPAAVRRRFAPEDNGNVTRTGRRSNFDRGDNLLADISGMPTPFGIAIESSGQLNARTTICTEKLEGMRRATKCIAQQQHTRQ